MSRPDLRYFVCDRCGFLWQARRAAKCGACGHRALWDFRSEIHATHHAAWIANPHESVRPL